MFCAPPLVIDRTFLETRLTSVTSQQSWFGTRRAQTTQKNTEENYYIRGFCLILKARWEVPLDDGETTVNH